jgi:hypothetical protein
MYNHATIHLLAIMIIGASKHMGASSVISKAALSTTWSKFGGRDRGEPSSQAHTAAQAPTQKPCSHCKLALFQFWFHSSSTVGRHSFLEMDSHRVRTDTNSDVTIYHILFQIRKYEYVYYRIQIQNGYFEFAFAFEYLLDLYHGVITIY